MRSAAKKARARLAHEIWKRHVRGRGAHWNWVLYAGLANKRELLEGAFGRGERGDLFVDRDWKPTANLQQAVDRCERIGTKQFTLVTLLYADHSLDARVMDVLRKKSCP